MDGVHCGTGSRNVCLFLPAVPVGPRSRLLRSLPLSCGIASDHLGLCTSRILVSEPAPDFDRRPLIRSVLRVLAPVAHCCHYAAVATLLVRSRLCGSIPLALLHCLHRCALLRHCRFSSVPPLLRCCTFATFDSTPCRTPHEKNEINTVRTRCIYAYSLRKLVFFHFLLRQVH